MKNLVSHFIILSVLFLTIQTYAQDANMCIQEGGMYEDNLNSICTNFKGEIFAVGTYKSNTKIGNYALDDYLKSPYLAKFDSTGNCIWAKGLYGHYSGGNNYGNGICLSKDGYVYITGSFYGTAYFTDKDYLMSTGGYTVSFNDDIFLAKFDTTGKFIWATNAGSKISGLEKGVSVTVDDNNNIYLTGVYRGECFFGYQNSIISRGDQDIFIAKYNSAGICLGVNSIGSKGTDFVNGLIYNKGNIYLTGSFQDTCYIGNISVPGIAYQNGFLCKYDTLQNFQYFKKFGGSVGNNTGYGVCCNVKGDLYLTGNLLGNTGNNTMYDGSEFTSTSGDHLFLAKISAPDGAVQWVNSIAGTSYLNSYAVASNNYNDAFITGSFMNSLQLTNGDQLSNTKYENSIFLIKYDENGNIKWSKQSYGNMSGVGKSIMSFKDKIYLGSEFNGTIKWENLIYNSNNNSYDFLITKFNDNDQVPTSINEQLPNNILNLYPNPGNEYINLDFGQMTFNNVEIKIYDMKGILMHQERFYDINSANKIVIINTSKFSKGVYSIELFTDLEVVNKKFVIK